MIDKDTLELWTNFWEETIQYDPRSKVVKPEVWNKIAEKYEKNHDPQKEAEQLTIFFDLLESTGIDLNGARVLDIGAGTGSLSIPLAKRGALVTALDFSEGMLKKLTERANQEQVSIEQTITQSWDTIDLDKEGFRNHFDLVIASMTPAIRTPDDFRHMLDAAKGVCYYNGWIKAQWDPAYYELHHLLYNDQLWKRNPFAFDGFFIPFVYLYLLGYHPKIILKKVEWQSKETIDDIVESVFTYFSVHQNNDKGIKPRIREFFAARAPDGIYESKSIVTTGVMVWDMKKQQ